MSKIILPRVRSAIKEPRECRFWQYPRPSPNDHYQNDMDYRAGVDAWCREKGQPGPHKWHQVRMISDKCELSTRADWWNQGPWKEAIFWVFMKPYYARFEGLPYGFYCLEFIECRRVISYMLRELGKTPWDISSAPMLMIPTEICKPCRYETTNGYSDHLRPREIIVPTQQEVDHEAIMKELVAEKTKEVVETVNDPRYSKLVDADGKQIIH